MFRQLGNLNLLVFFVGVVAATVFAGVPIAFAFGLAVFGYLALTTQTPLMVLIGRMDEGMSHLILLAVPLFVFLGLLIEMTGMARAMVAFSQACWGTYPAACTTFLSPGCIWSPGFPARRQPTWRPSRRYCFRR
jgi:TRAP-type mannitol/chloroaromatic compound transport system permease large subunit